MLMSGLRLELNEDTLELSADSRQVPTIARSSFVRREIVGAQLGDALRRKRCGVGGGQARARWKSDERAGAIALLQSIAASEQPDFRLVRLCDRGVREQL